MKTQTAETTGGIGTVPVDDINEQRRMYPGGQCYPRIPTPQRMAEMFEAADYFLKP